MFADMESSFSREAAGGAVPRLRKAPRGEASCARALRALVLQLKSESRRQTRHAAAPRRASGPEQRAFEALDLGAHDDLAVVRERLVVALDGAEVVEVIDHEAGTLGEALLAGVGHPMQALEAGAIAEVEACDRIDRLSRRILGVEEVAQRCARERLAH